MTQTITPPPAFEAPAGRRAVAVLVVILTGQFMAVLDAAIVNVAIPSIRADLGTGGAALQLIVAGYVIAYAVLLISGARLGDRVTQRRAFLAGLAVFTVASLACGLAWDAVSLIVFRFAQGAGAAAMVPQVMTLIQRTFTGAARARALSLYAAIISGGMVAGQILGGLIVDADLAGSGWRGVFLVNVPIGAALLVVAPRVLPATPPSTERRLDLPGLLTLTATVLLLVVPLVLGRELGYPAWTWLCAGAGALGVAVFAGIERRVAARGGEPLFSPRVLAAPGLLLTATTLLLIMTSFGGWLFATAIHLQGELGYSALRAGVQFLPMGVTFALAGLYWDRLPRRWHSAMIPGGLLLSAVAPAWLAVLLREGAALGPAAALALALLGLGTGLAFSPLMTRALATVPMTLAADASGILVTSVQLGVVVGIAVFGSVFFAVVTSSAVGAVQAVQLLAAGTSAVAAVFAALAVRRTRR
ncbi:MFS transporter [Nocardia neocaledoniensis]|uniref:MFS transporter n=1 Tax=Nocardia neocaledoniensis TaxID=236511 RepID=UPI00245574DF|nr:MFS transporter [Nocardia neocaledoniensis]